VFFNRNDLPKSGEQLTFKAKHEAMSVSIASNIFGYEDLVCFVTDGNEETFVQKMIERLEPLADVACNLQREKFSYVFEALSTSENIRKDKISK